MIKALDSPWKIRDRSTNWLKIKPDYGDGYEIDCLIVGCYFGTGRGVKATKSLVTARNFSVAGHLLRQGGKISEFLLALAMQPKNLQELPSVFETFCK